MSELSTVTLRIIADLSALQRDIGLRLEPVLQALASDMRRLYNSLPGMPYTGLSLWDADQMKADR